MTHFETAPATAQFLTQLRSHTITPAEGEGQPYVRTRDLVSWLTHTTDTQEPIAKHLLNDAYRNLNSSFPADAEFFSSYEKICGGGPDHPDRCIIAFSILLEIGLGHWIHSVQQWNIVDHLLPMQFEQLEKKFNGMIVGAPAMQAGNGHAQRGTEYARRFDDAQWKYFPVSFTSHMDKNFPERQVFPICRKKEIGKGGQARVFQILVQADYISPELDARLEKDEHTRVKDDEFGMCFQLALKTFESAQVSYWANEKRAFTVLEQQRNKGMIQCLGYFAILRSVTETENRSQFREMNILLEYGQFDLMGIFGLRNPPVNSPEIEAFWRSLLEVVDALRGIHDFKTQNDRYHGWHNDIKPENIIVVNDKYKLADPGFAKFKKKLEEQDGESFPKIIADGGTITYSAPERYARKSGSKVEVSQSVDLWSIGCIFSMAATWIVLGYQGIRQYDYIRRRAIDDVIREAHKKGITPKIQEGDFFHDGIGVLPVVKEWHRYLSNSVRRTDHITKKVLDLTESKLLICNRKMSARKLYQELQELLEGCQKEQIPDELKNVMQALLDLDKSAHSVPETISSQATATKTGPIRQDQSRNPMDRLTVHGPLLKTASRLQSLSKFSTAEPLPPVININHHHEEARSPKSSEQSTRQSAEQRSVQRPFSMPPQPVEQRASTYMSIRTEDGRTPDPVNVIQARENLSSRSWKLSTREDEYVKAFFGNRDIKFLVDNSSSMISYWTEATYLVETLFLMAKNSDKDGLDLYFTASDPRRAGELTMPYLRGEKDVKHFKKAMKDNGPRKGIWTRTDIVAPVKNIFDEFLGTATAQKQSNESQKQSKSIKSWVKKPAEGPKALTLLILTNGAWDAMENPDAINTYIENLLQTLTTRGLIKAGERGSDRFVSIEFIQFGDDPTVTERLRALDDGMELRGYEDIIDHEMFSVNGDVRKMLLGSFNPYMDESKRIRLAHEDSSTPTIPQTRHSMPPGALGGSHNQANPNSANGSSLPRVRTPTNSTGSSAYYTPPECESRRR